MVLRLNRHDYWAYGTSVGWENGYFPILHSGDLVHWKYVGTAFSMEGYPRWSGGDFWGPDVVKRGATYYFYYTGQGRQSHCVAVATAGSPKGPFKPRNIISCGDAGGLGFIDPDLFLDQDGKSYLYVSADAPHRIVVLPMKPDMLHAAGPSIPLFGVTQRWENGRSFSTVEGPFTIRHNGLYYLFYSGNDWQSNYAMGYATGKSPTGPFTKYLGNPILRGTRHVFGPGGGSVVEGPDDRLWMAYHGRSHPMQPSGPDTRTLRIDPLLWHGNTVTVPVHPR
jgi:beta-xylosidase